MKLVLIEWVDSHGGSEWQPLKDIIGGPRMATCRSVGWLASKDDKRTLIVPHLSGDDSCKAHSGLGNLSIPNKSITKMRVLRGA